MTLPKLPEPHHSALVFVAFRENKSPVEAYYTSEDMLQFQRDTQEACAELMEEQDTQAPKHNARAIRSMKHE